MRRSGDSPTLRTGARSENSSASRAPTWRRTGTCQAPSLHTLIDTVRGGHGGSAGQRITRASSRCTRTIRGGIGDVLGTGLEVSRLTEAPEVDVIWRILLFMGFGGAFLMLSYLIRGKERR